MTLLEYVQSLQDQGATDIAAKAQKWKEENEYKAPEVSDEAKINPAATQMGAVVAGKKMKASNKTFSDSVSIFGDGKSQYQEGDFASTFKNTFGISIDDSRKIDKQRADYNTQMAELNKVSKIDDVYSPGDGYNYKFSIDPESNTLKYEAKVVGSEKFKEKSGIAAFSVANMFGHLNEEQSKQLAEINAQNKAESEKQKKREQELLQAKENQLTAMPLVQEGVVESVDTGTSYTDKINYHVNQLILNSEESTLKLKGRNTKLYRSKVEEYIDSGMTEEEAEAKATSESSVKEAYYDVTRDSADDIINNLKGYTDQEKEDVRLAIDLSKKLNKAQSKIQTDARMRVAAPFSDIRTSDESIKEQKSVLDKIDKLNKKYLGETTRQVATPEALADFTEQFNTLQGNYGRGSAKTNEAIFNQTINGMVKNDPFIKAELLKLQINADQEIKDFSAELQKKYDTSTVEGNKKATEELQQFAKSLTQDKLLEGDVFKERFSQIQTVGVEALGNINLEDKERELLKARMQDPILKYLEVGKKLPGFKFAAIGIEGIMKGSKRFQNAVNVVQKDFAADGAKESINMISSLEKALKSGEVDLTTKLSFDKGGFMTVEKALDYFKKAKDYDEKNIIEQLDDLSGISKDLSLYREIDPEDSWLTKTFQTVAESVPMMAAAVGGGAVNYLTGGTASAVLAPIVSTLGTAALFTQFYGDAWEDTFMEGARSEAKSKGIDLDNISEEERRDFLLQALQSGKYDKSANAAATAALQTATEKFGFSKQMSAASKALGLGKEGITSLIQGQWRQTGRAFLQGSLAKAESALSEGVTEWSQTVIGDLNKGFAYGKGTSFVDFNSAWEAGKAGASAGLLMPGGAAIISQTRVEIQNLSRKIAIQFAPDSGFGQASLVADNYFKAAQTELNQRLKLGVNPDGTEYTIQQHQEDTNALASTSNAYRRIPNTASAEVRTELLDLMVRRDKLQLEINKVNDSDLTVLQQLELNSVKDEIKELAKEASAPVGVKTDSEKLKKGAGVAISQLGAGVERVDNTEDFISSVSSLEAQGVKANINRNKAGEILPAEEQDYGIFAKVPDGKGGFDIQLIINDASSKADGLLPADKHELLHIAAMKMDDASKVKMGGDILNSLLNDSNIEINRKTRRLLKAYELDLDKGDITVAEFFEEVMAVTSDGLTPSSKTGVADIRVKDISKFKAIGQKILQAIGWRQNFTDGQQAIDFLKDFNADVLKGEGLSEGVLSKFDTKTDTEVDMGLETEVDLGDVKSSKRVETQEQADRNKELVQKAKDGDITASRDLVQENSGLILRLLGFNKDIGDIEADSLLQAVTDMATPGMADLVFPGRKQSLVEEYKESSGEVSTFLGRLKQRKQEIYTAAGLDASKFDTESLSTPEARQIAADETIATKSIKETSTKQTDATSFGPAKNKKQDLENIIQVKDVDRPNFKSLNNKYFNDAAESLFGISGKKVRGNASLKYGGTKTDPTSSEANTLQNVFKNSENVRSFIKTMPKYNVATKETIINKQGESIDVSRDTYGRALGINPKVIEVFYDKVTTAIPGVSSAKGRSLGKTTQPPVYKIKPEFDTEVGPIGKEAITKLQSLIGITPSGELSIPVKGPARTEFGSALTGLSKMYVDNVINTIGRSKLDSKQAKADLGAGKPKSMASKRTQKLNWKQTDEALVAEFKIGDRTYKTTLEETAFMEFDEGQTYQDIEDIANDLDILEDAEGDPIESSEKFYHLEFGDTELGKGITGKGNAFEVFTTTMNGVVDYLKANPSIEGVVFTAKEPSRIRLYKTLSQVLAGKLNGSYGFKNDTFIVSTKPEAVSKPKSMASKRFDLARAKDISSTPFVVELVKKISTRITSRGKEVKIKVTDLDSKEMQEFTSIVNDFLSKYPQHGPYLRQGYTGMKQTHTYGEVSIFDKYVPGFKGVKKPITRLGYSKSRFQSAKTINNAIPTLKADNKARIGLLKDIALDIEAFLSIKGNESKGYVFDQFFKDGSRDQNHPLRYLIPLKFATVDPVSLKIITNEEVTEEHTSPVVGIGRLIMDAAKNGNVEQVFTEVIEPSAAQGGLLRSIDENMSSSLKQDQANEFYEKVLQLYKEGKLDSVKDALWYIRYSIENDVNPFSIMLLENGITVGEYFLGKTEISKVGLVETQSIANNLINDILTGKITQKQAKQEFKIQQENLLPGKVMASKRDSDLIPDAIKYDRPITVQTAINALEKTDKSLELARKLDQPVKKIRVFDFDDTLARTKSNVLYTMPDGTTGAIDAATFAKEAGNMEAEGAQWDFSEFSKVMQGSKGPLLDVAKIIADKRGTKDVFVLTARPADAAGPIKEFLASMGLDIPLANITGLGDGTPQAKAGWIMGKAAEGYNDFYFADDHTGNVKAVKDVLSQIDVKSKVQLAKASKKQTFDTVVNDMIEDSSGIETYKKYSAARAKTVGASKGKYNFLIPPSAEDFTGLLYKMIGKGKKGDAQMAFLKTNLLDTYNRAESAVTQAKISAANDFVALKTKLKTLPKTLSKETGIGKFTYSHAVRVAAWTKQGMDIPGLSKRDIKELNDFINKDAKLRVFTDELIKIQKGKEYPKPGKDWLGGNITTDIIGGINKVNRAEYQQEWRENIDIIFSEDNMNKMEAAYGSRWREAMEDSIRRMKSGSNRPIGGNRVTEGLLNWLNNSVGAVMFLNTRSALLQTISAVNFINLSDNNIVKAGVAFANQKQFWGDFMTLMNSDYLVERRNGLKINVSESEIADAVREAKNKPKAAIAFLLSKGFVMTRFADSFAIASGGSTFYRNRVKKYVKEGIEQGVAEKQAFADFKAIAEESQQSSSPSKISQQQASAAGRVILAWANTPMQYARIQKRAAQDIINGRGDWKTNVSKIVYYGAIQNLIFNSLQNAAFALGFGEDDEDDEVKAKKKEEKAYKVLNGMIDSQLKGLGVFGTASVAIKNTLMTLYEEHGKKGSKYENAVEDLESFSPPLGSKIGKITGGLQSASWNKKDMKEKGFSLDNPAYMAGAQVVTGLTNVPFDRVMKKINNIRGIVNERSALWQKVALGLGWSTWDVGLGYYGGFDKEKPLTPKQQLKLEVDTMKKDTSKSDQVKTLLDFGLTKKQVRELKNENNRVKKILELQKKDKDAGSKK